MALISVSSRRVAASSASSFCTACRDAPSAASRSFTHPLAALSARISNLNKYEFEVTVLKGSGAKQARFRVERCPGHAHDMSETCPQVERFRVETWAMLHAWVNGLTLLSTIARARAQSSSRAV